MTRPALRVALDQGTGPSGDTDAALERLAERARSAAASGAHLLITPEMSMTGYALAPDAIADRAEPADGPLSRAVAGIAARAGVAIVHGFPERDGERVYNSVQLVGTHGTALATYRKTHLFGDLDHGAFVPGEDLVVQTDLHGHRIGLLICYDVEFPETVRAHALAGTELLVVPTALMAPDTAVASVLVPARAMENRIHLAYVNRCDAESGLDYVGLSTLAGPDGAELLRAGRQEALLVADLDAGAARAPSAEPSYLDDRRPDLYQSLSS
ncbi:carbon-nitrogen hydrolase family protein [Nocardiopsis kunsanensis]|uniref:Hydrolase n=1 Tax=Nocardiopsis kunsanensis TaxID=141693 RepID=A0A918XDM6_9ACTN|nr:carbon-nitrogen hydrolase family protein [Nocardiopsis kunsanensis]GHD26154.1 hydrolase [Nocardiopsis kunsanensis]